MVFVLVMFEGFCRCFEGGLGFFRVMFEVFKGGILGIFQCFCGYFLVLAIF